MASLATLLLSLRVGQSRVEIMSETLDVFRNLLRTNRAALFCTFSIFSMSFLVWGSQTVDEYSRMGRTKVLYANSLTVLELILRFLRRNPSVLFALAEMFPMCSLHDRFLVNLMPR